MTCLGLLKRLHGRGDMLIGSWSVNGNVNHSGGDVQEAVVKEDLETILDKRL